MTSFKELTTELRREMNGAVSGSMRMLDPKGQRKINFGVSLPTIKAICSKYDRSRQLAEELRSHDIREWWLAAAYVDDFQTIDIEYANHIANGWKNEEEATIYGMVLFSHSPHAMDIIDKWAGSPEKLKDISAGRIIASIAPNISDEVAADFMEKTNAEIPVRAIYEHHPSLRQTIRDKGPYNFSWILDEIDSL